MDSMSDAEFDAKVGFPVGERYVPKSKLDAAEARLDAAERERDALREALQETDDFIERVNLDERMCCSGQDCGCRGSTQRDYLLHNIRAALTANHSAPVVEE